MNRNPGAEYYVETTQDSLAATKQFATNVLAMKSHLVAPVVAPRS